MSATNLNKPDKDPNIGHGGDNDSFVHEANPEAVSINGNAATQLPENSNAMTAHSFEDAGVELVALRRSTRRSPAGVEVAAAVTDTSTHVVPALAAAPTESTLEEIPVASTDKSAPSRASKDKGKAPIRQSPKKAGSVASKSSAPITPTNSTQEHVPIPNVLLPTGPTSGAQKDYAKVLRNVVALDKAQTAGEQRITEVSARVDDVASDLRGVNSTISRLERVMEDQRKFLESERDRAHADLDEARRTGKAEIDALKVEVEKLTVRVIALTSAENETRKGLNDVDRDIAELREQFRLSARIDTLGTELVAIRAGAPVSAPPPYASISAPLPARPAPAVTQPLPLSTRDNGYRNMPRGNGRGGARGNFGNKRPPSDRPSGSNERQNEKRPRQEDNGEVYYSEAARRHASGSKTPAPSAGSSVIIGPHNSTDRADEIFSQVLQLMPPNDFVQDVLECRSEGLHIRVSFDGTRTAGRLVDTWERANPLGGTGNMLTIRLANARDEAINRLFGPKN